MGTEQGRASTAARVPCGCSAFENVSNVFSSGGARRVGIVPNGSGLDAVVGKRDVRARVRTETENRDDLNEN